MSELRSKSRPRIHPVMRVLAAALLVTIIYGSAVHRHAGVSPYGSTVTRASDASCATPSHEGGIADCSVCQLHRQLAASLIAELPQTALPETWLAVFPEQSRPWLSIAKTPARGRAPPLTSLT